MLVQKFAKLKWWQIALISIAASALGRLSGGLSSKKEKKLYNNELEQAPWAPPAWLFGPAWTFNNFCLLMALKRILNSNTDEKKKLLALQGVIWIIFFSFNYVFVRKKSVVLAAVWTMADMILAGTSFSTAFKWDKKTAMYYLPLLAWTSFASTLADYQALKNPDPVLGTKELL